MAGITNNFDVVVKDILLVSHEVDPPVKLIAISKHHPKESVLELIKHKHTVFGENKVQEAKLKFTDIKQQYPDIELHLVGPLQTNKVKDAVALFDVIQSVDRVSLAAKLSKEMVRTNRYPDCFIQVNIGNEPQKSGIKVEELDDFIKVCIGVYHLPIAGLMCIPPVDEDSAPYFEQLKSLQTQFGLLYSSMGMSGDYPCAIKKGASHIRIGTAIFGVRQYAQ